MKNPILLVLALFMALQSKATVIYINVYDYIYTNPTLYYDIDQDGDNDFSFVKSGGAYIITCLKSTSKFAADSTNTPKSYANGAAWGTYHWQTGVGTLYNPVNSTGLFGNAAGFLMVQFQNTAGHIFYGWFYIANSGETVSGYAYDNTPNSVVQPGQTFSGIGEVSKASLPVTKVSNGFISFKDCGDIDQVSVYAFDGRKLIDIENPVEMQSYQVSATGQIVVIAYYRHGELLGTSKYLAQ
jgi:hypothetical protein